jgi:hypothetical protein
MRRMLNRKMNWYVATAYSIIEITLRIQLSHFGRKQLVDPRNRFLLSIVDFDCFDIPLISHLNCQVFVFCM